MRMTRLTGMALVAAAMVAPSTMKAQVTTYTTLASYLAAISAPGTDTYAGFNVSGTTSSPLSRNAGAYSYTAAASTSTFFGAGTAGDPWLSTNIATDAVAFSNFSSGVRGVGGNFFGSDISGAFQSGGIQISWVVAGLGSGSTQLLNATTGTFFGVVSNSAFTSFTVSAIQPTSGFLWPTVDNLTLGAAAITTAPEPQTYALVGVGLLVIGAVARRRRLG